MEWMQIIMGVLGGIGIFLYGMYIASEGLKKSTSHHLKRFLTKVTKNQFFGSLAGIVLAAALQSSSAATVMVVGFVNAGLMTLRQAMGVMLGSAIGTTITVQLIAFKITDYALLFVAIGALVFLSASPHIKSIGSVILGFGFVFFGMGIITDAMIPLQNNPAFTELFVYLSDNLLLMVLIALVFTAIIQNSAATIAIAMTLAATGSLSLEAAVAIVYGANIGTVVTALISSISASKDAQRTAVAHAIFKIIGVLVFLPFTHLFVRGLELTGGDIGRQIANGHTIFNVVNLFILLPFCNKFADWMVMLIPEKEKTPKDVKYLNKDSLEVSTVALVQTKKELWNMGKNIETNMFSRVSRFLEDESISDRRSVVHYEDSVDEVYRHIYHYLQDITKKDLSEAESNDSLKYLYINNELEGVSDSLELIALTSMKLEEGNIHLNKWEMEGITKLYKDVLLSYQEALDAFEDNDQEKAYAVINRNPMILRMEKDLRFQHFNQGDNESSRLSSIYVDIMNELLRINHHTVNISHTLIGMV